jgi:energy-coupling factor transporter ATP-binding protein EcfA2
MPAVVLEGPDGSGKTALAYALLGCVPPGRGLYIKSPAGKDSKWKDRYNYWVQSTRARHPDKLITFDRTPEISEAVYGSLVRYNCRLHSPVESLSTLHDHSTTVIMCLGSEELEGEHEDPMGNDIREHHQKVLAGYTLVTDLLKSLGTGILLWDRVTSPFFKQIVHRLHIRHTFYFPSPPQDFWTSYQIGKDRYDTEPTTG